MFFSTYKETELRFSTGKPTANAKWHVMRGVIVYEREREAGRQLWGLGTARPQPELVLPAPSPSCSVPIPLASLSSCPPSVCGICCLPPPPGGVAKSPVCWASLRWGSGPGVNDQGSMSKATFYQRTQPPGQRASSGVHTPSSRIFSSISRSRAQARVGGGGLCRRCRYQVLGLQRPAAEWAQRSPLWLPAPLSHGCFPSRIAWVLSLWSEYVDEGIDLVRGKHGCF